MNSNTPQDTTPAPAPQGPDFDRIAADLQSAIVDILRMAYNQGVHDGQLAYPPAVQALIAAAKRYTDKCDESSIDRLCDASWALSESEAANV